MKTVALYYFSATGNTMTTARELAAALEEQEMQVKIRNVVELRDEAVIKEDADLVGFLFPVYYGDMAYPMRAALEKLELRPDAYAFAFTTCRGHVGAAPIRVNDLLKAKGQHLALALNVVMPGNSWISTPEENAERLAAQKENIRSQVGRILAGEQQEYVQPADAEPLKETPVGRPNNFRGIMADENCIACGTCVRICPMKNIQLVDGHAEIGDSCATCLACFHWCPKEAIYMSKEDTVARRFKYHHPDVKLKDMIVSGS